MRWKKAYLKIGDRRNNCLKFAWLPTMMNDGVVVWLESYTYHKVWLGYLLGWQIDHKQTWDPIM